MVRGTESRRRISGIELLVDGASDLLERLAVAREASDKLALLPTRAASNGLAALEAAQQRAVVHALVALACAVHAVEDLGMRPGGGVRLTHALATADLFLGQDVLARDARTWIGVWKAVAHARA